MNSLSTNFSGGKSFKDYFFISLDFDKSAGQAATRYVVLKPFINSFTRTNSVTTDSPILKIEL